MPTNRGPAGDLLARIEEHLRRHPEGVASGEIARRFLQVQDPRPRVIGPVVEALLAGDPRFRLVGTQLWAVAAGAAPKAGGGRPEALLFGAVLRSGSVPGRVLLALLRVKEGREEGTLLAPRRIGDPTPPPDRFRVLAENARLVVYRAAGPFLELARGADDLLAPPALRLRAWASRFVPSEALRSPRDLAARLGLDVREGDDPLVEARLLAEIYARLEERHGPPGDREEGPDREEIAFVREGGEAFLDSLPESPGIYRMRDREGRLLYVGKSRNLRSRVGSYFAAYDSLPAEKRKLVGEVARIDVEVLGSELEALLEEWRAIRKGRPPYNEKVEAHGGPSPVVRGKNLVLFLPSTDARSVVLYLLRADGAHKRLRARRNPRRTDRLGAAILGFFAGEGGAREPGAYAILSRWIEAERHRVTLVDAGSHEGEDGLMRVVAACLCDPEVASGARIDPI